MVNIIFSLIVSKHPFCPLGTPRAGLPRVLAAGSGGSVFKECQGCVRHSTNERPPKNHEVTQSTDISWNASQDEDDRCFRVN